MLMTEPLGFSSLEIRTFSTFEEISALLQFRENAPLTPGNYKRLFGDYHLPEKVRCCVQKENGKLCEEPHNHGWLVERDDGTLTLVGSDCGVNKFGADRRLLADQTRYRNEKARLARIAALSEALNAKVERVEALGQVRSKVKDLEGRIRRITAQLGDSVVRRLQDMVRTRRFDVVIDVTKRREYVDAKGQDRHEDTTFQHNLGNLAGLELVTTGSYTAIYDAINDVVRAYEHAQVLVAEPDLRRKSKEVENVAWRLQRYEAILTDAQRLQKLEQQFVTNDFFLLCYLTSNLEERNKAARLAMVHSGRNAEKMQPSDWFSRREAVIKEQLRAHKISAR